MNFLPLLAVIIGYIWLYIEHYDWLSIFSSVILTVSIILVIIGWIIKQVRPDWME